VAHPEGLVVIYFVWATACLTAAFVLRRRAPLLSIGLFGSILGSAVTLLLGSIGRPAGVPPVVAFYATLGLVAGASVASIRGLSPTGPVRTLTRMAAFVGVLTIPLSAVLTLGLQAACPLYVGGRASGWCNYQGGDVLGGWVTGVVALFVFDAVVVVALLLISASHARRIE
jgi:hypothetical protein